MTEFLPSPDAHPEVPGDALAIAQKTNLLEGCKMRKAGI